MSKRNRYVIGHNGQQDCVYGLSGGPEDNIIYNTSLAGVYPMDLKEAKKQLRSLLIDKGDDTRRIYKLVEVK